MRLLNQIMMISVVFLTMKVILMIKIIFYFPLISNNREKRRNTKIKFRHIILTFTINFELSDYEEKQKRKKIPNN